MLKKNFFKWALVPMVAAIAFVGLNSFSEEGENSELLKPNGKVLSGDLPCSWVCYHPDGFDSNGQPRLKAWDVTGATKRDCINGTVSDNCRPRHTVSCHGGSCGSGYALPH